MGYSFEVNGMEELAEALNKAVKKSPDLAKETLRKTSLKFKKAVIQKTNERVTTHTGKLIKGYKLDKIEGYGINVSRGFRGTAPHTHLVENGHNQVKNGKRVGWVPGKFMMEDTRKEFGEVLAKDALGLINEIFQEGGF